MCCLVSDTPVCLCLVARHRQTLVARHRQTLVPRHRQTLVARHRQTLVVRQSPGSTTTAPALCGGRHGGALCPSGRRPPAALSRGAGWGGGGALAGTGTPATFPLYTASPGRVVVRVARGLLAPVGWVPPPATVRAR